MNQIYDGGEFPKNFMEAIIFPLYKKGDLAIVSNFRGISFLTAFYKIYTQLIHFRMQIFACKENLLHESQAGFRRGYSTCDNIFILSSIIEDSIRKPCGKVFAFFIDFSAAFDTVNRNSLILKLAMLGYSTKCCDAIKQIYNVTKAKVWTSEGYTESFETKAGVRQGCLLSPLLFTLYINDLIECVDEGGFCFDGVWIRMLLYADDIVFLASDPKVLQNMIDKLYKYCVLWDLKVNLSKSKIMVFRKAGRISKNLSWTYGDQQIDIVPTYKYLGINFVSTGKFGSHLDIQMGVAKIALNSIYKNIFYLQARNIDAYLRVFNSVARSVLCYAAQVWGFQKWEIVERLLRFFIKKLLRLPYNTPNYMILLETGCDSLFVFTLKLHWKFLIHTWQLSNSRFTKVMMQHGINREHNWYKYFVKMATDCGNLDDFNNFQNANIKEPFDVLLDFVAKSEQQSLLDKVILGQLHPLYKSLKTICGRESYFNESLTMREIRFIMMARTEMLPLNWKPWFPDNNFQCFLCNMRVNEDTEHFIKQCPILKEFRPQSFVSADINCILNGDLGWKILSDFVCHALNYRNQLVLEFNG